MNILSPLAALGVSIISHEHGDYSKGLSELLLLEPEKVQEIWPPNFWTNQKAWRDPTQSDLSKLNLCALCSFPFGWSWWSFCRIRAWEKEVEHIYFHMLFSLRLYLEPLGGLVVKSTCNWYYLQSFNHQLSYLLHGQSLQECSRFLEMSKGQCGHNTAAFKVSSVRWMRLMSLVQQKRQWDKRKGWQWMGLLAKTEIAEHGQMFGTNFSGMLWNKVIKQGLVWAHLSVLWQSNIWNGAYSVLSSGSWSVWRQVSIHFSRLWFHWKKDNWASWAAELPQPKPEFELNLV